MILIPSIFAIIIASWVAIYLADISNEKENYSNNFFLCKKIIFQTNYLKLKIRKC